jgi:hypothetical protein
MQEAREKRVLLCDVEASERPCPNWDKGLNEENGFRKGKTAMEGGL